MKPRRVAVGWRFWPARAEVRPQPVGVVGIIAPWNYPVNLAVVPLVSAIAAGNHAYLKPSEHTPRTSQWLRELLADVFPAERVAVALGGSDVGAAFAALPFDHLLFTGSASIGRKVLAAAIPNLTPVTLELGGKSPALVAPDFPLDLAAARVASGKWFTRDRPASAWTTCWSMPRVATHSSTHCARSCRRATATCRSRPTTRGSSMTANSGAWPLISTTRAIAAPRCCSRSRSIPAVAATSACFHRHWWSTRHATAG
jgi:acyl-CoA reductase-like NAD-dependent aldehyde dehydrogenase